MKIAVTGSNGRVGRVLVTLLRRAGHDVLGIDINEHPAPPPAPNSNWTPPPWFWSMEGRTEPPNAFWQSDLMDDQTLLDKLKGCDGVVHLAAIVSPNITTMSQAKIYANNTVTSYNILQTAALLGIPRVVQASSVNAIGGAYSHQPRYDYFPVDENHPTYSEDPYSLSKWVMEAQGNSMARRFENLTICSMRFHGIWPTKPGYEIRIPSPPKLSKDLWAYTSIVSGAQACVLGLSAPIHGHEAFFITAPHNITEVPSAELAQTYYPEVPITGDLTGHTSFYNCAKAERLLGWTHEDLEL